MTNKLTIFLAFILSFASITAQDNSLNDQFNNITQKSNNYKDYKVVKKNRLNALQRNVLDTVSNLHKQINTSSVEITKQNSEIVSLNNELSTTKNELIISKEKENGIPVFGMITQKSTYNITALSIIGILLSIIVILFIKYKSGFDVIKTTKSNLAETDEEFEGFRQRSLEREQQLRRKLQDEINKNKS